MTEILMPSSWYHHTMQFDMIACGIKTPVYNNKGLGDILRMPLPHGANTRSIETSQAANQTVFLPAFGGISMRNVYKASGGNPLAMYDRNDMCIIMSPTIDLFSYTKTVHGQQILDLKTGDCIGAKRGYLPSNFRKNASHAQHVAIDTLRSHIKSTNFSVVAVKLNPLASGRGNLAIYLKFPDGCPFDKQCHLTSSSVDCLDNDQKPVTIRVIPKPTISHFDETLDGVKFEIKLSSKVKGDDFINLFNIVQSRLLNENENGLDDKVYFQLRYMKMVEQNQKIVGMLQMNEPATDMEIQLIVDKLNNASFPSNCELVSVECHRTKIEH